MQNEIKIGGITWINLENPKKLELLQLGEKYDLHEIIIDDIVDSQTQDKVDTYDNTIFLVLHFPKYDQINKRYSSNEFSFILGKNFIITITSLPSNNIDKIKEGYLKEAQSREEDEEYKISPYFIMYKIIDAMYDKTLGILGKSNRDIMILEEGVFAQNGITKELLEDIMIKKRNLVYLKHNYIFQGELVEEIQKTIEKFYEGQLDLYFEDLMYKIDRIENTIDIQSKNVNSLTEAYNSLMNIRLNSILTKLTVFTLIIGTLTLTSGMFGMNVIIPLGESSMAFPFIVILMIIISALLIIFFKKRGWFD